MGYDRDKDLYWPSRSLLLNSNYGTGALWHTVIDCSTQLQLGQSACGCNDASAFGHTCQPANDIAQLLVCLLIAELPSP